MYNLRPLTHNEMVVIKLVLRGTQWSLYLPQGEIKANRFYCREALSQHKGFSMLTFLSHIRIVQQ